MLVATSLGHVAQVRRTVRSSPPARRASPRRSTPTCRRPTTTAPRSRATRATCSPSPGNVGAHGITFADLLGGLTMMLAPLHPDHPHARGGRRAVVSKRVAPAGPGTMRTDTPHLRRADRSASWSLIVGALTFFPAFLLGPIVQGMTDRNSSSMKRNLSPLRLIAIARLHRPARARPTARRRPASRRSPFGDNADGNPNLIAEGHQGRPEATSSRGRRRPTTTPEGTFFSNRGPELQHQRAVLLPRPARRLPHAQRPVQPRADEREGPGGRRHHLRLGRGSAHLRTPTREIQARRVAAGARPPARARGRPARQGLHRRPLPRRVRRAGRATPPSSMRRSADDRHR